MVIEGPEEFVHMGAVDGGDSPGDGFEDILSTEIDETPAHESRLRRPVQVEELARGIDDEQVLGPGPAPEAPDESRGLGQVDEKRDTLSMPRGDDGKEAGNSIVRVTYGLKDHDLLPFSHAAGDEDRPVAALQRSPDGPGPAGIRGAHGVELEVADHVDPLRP